MLWSRGELAGAGLGVLLEHEPAINPKLLGCPPSPSCRTWVRPLHRGRIDMGEKVIINIKTFLDGHRPPDRVIPSML